MPRIRAPRSPDLERVVQVLSGRVEEAAPGPSGGGWLPARPGSAEGGGVTELIDLTAGVGDGSRGNERGRRRRGESGGELDEELRLARRPGLLSVPASVRAGRISVSSSAVVAVLALVVALSCAFVLRILWAERAVQDRPVGVSRARSATDSPDGKVTPEVVSSSAGPSGGPAASKPSGAPTQLVVHVVGQVAKPGLVRLAVGARVADAIEAAGGATRKGDVAVLNLARVVVDGEQILVPKPGEAGAGVAAPGASGAGATAPGAGAGGAGGLVNLNTADLTLLETLPGVGPVLAQRILDWRTEHGSFTSVEELGEVSGIGDKMLSQLRSKVTT